MKDFKNLETTVLVDMLAGHTAEYLRMIHEGVPEADYYECKHSITELQNEINYRQSALGRRHRALGTGTAKRTEKQ